jgi:hypothetical protein
MQKKMRPGDRMSDKMWIQGIDFRLHYDADRFHHLTQSAVWIWRIAGENLSIQ